MKQACTPCALRIAQWLLAAATLLAAALLIAQCADIYRVGTAAENMTSAGVRIRDVYSREIVGERLGRIVWAFVLWAAALAATLALRALMPKGGKPTTTLSPESRLEQAMLRLSPTPAIKAEEWKRGNACVACAVVCVLCGAMAGGYFLAPNRFASRDLETVMGAMLRWVAPFTAVAFAALMLLTWFNGKSRSRQLEAAKAAPRREPEPPKAQAPAPLPAGRVALYLAALGLIIAGVRNGGMYDVLVKAINICTECIGLG